MILDFYLSGFIPLSTVGIKSVTMNTKQQINLFISANGSSKSSVLKELHPFPPDSSKFLEGGSKVITLVNNNKVYKLTSIMGKEPQHKFEVDGENLNTGNTATAQRMLVETHFGITQQCAKIMSGLYITDLFNSMSPGKRKDFLMDLYPNDTTYAMSVFVKLKDEYNSLRGALRNQIARYAIEKQTLESINKLSETELMDKVNLLDDEIKEGLLLSGQLGNNKSYSNLQLTHDNVIRNAVWLSQCNIVNVSGYTRVGLQRQINTTENQLKHAQDKQSYYSNLLAEYQSQVSLKDIKQDPKQIEARLKTITAELTLQYHKRDTLTQFFKEHSLLSTAYEQFGGRFVVGLTELRSYLLNVVVSSVPTLTGNGYQKWMEDKDHLVNEKVRTEQLLQDKQHTLQHYRNADDIECPDCKHTFKVGITRKDINIVENDIKGLTLRIEQLTNQITELETKIENDKEWFQTMQALYQFLRNQRYTEADLSKVVKEYDIGKKDGTVLVNVINQLVAYDDCMETIKPLEAEKVVNTTQITLLKQNYIGGLIEKINTTETKVNQYNNSIRLYQKKLRIDNVLLQRMEEYDTKLTQFRLNCQQFKTMLSSEFNHQLKQQVDIGVSSRTLDKNQIMSEIIRNKSMHSVVDSIDEDIQRLKRRIKMVKLLMDSLCPNKGFIGKLMSDFIKTFCGNVNAIIRSFTDMPLLIKPCNKDNGDLTYKFPVVNGYATEASDISDCSAGESEILNWTIRKVAMRYKPNWFPLFMDEVGAFLDEVNRSRFFEYLQQILANKEHEQLFMVSHYVAQHGMFHNPNIISFKSEGLTIHGDINSNTTLQTY